MIYSLKDEKYIVPFNMSREAFLDCFKEYALQHKLLPLSFFTRLSIDIQGYYIPTYLFNGKVDAQWLATRYSVIKTTKAAGLNNQRLENSTSTVAKPVASNSVSEFSILAPSCQYGKLPIPLWNYVNGYIFDITQFRSSIEKCDNDPSLVGCGIEIQTIDNENVVVWEDYAKQAVIRNANSKKMAEINEAGLEDSQVNCIANCEEDTHIVFLPCWYAQIQYGKEKYFAISVANMSLKNFSCSLPDSILQKLLCKVWNLMSTILLIVFPIFFVKYAKMFAQAYLGYSPRPFFSEPFILAACRIAVFILGIITWRKIVSLIETGANKVKVHILQSSFSNSGIH